MKSYITKPLELTRRNLKEWETLNYECTAIICENLANMKEVVRLYTLKFMERLEKIFIVIWFFDNGISQPYYIELFEPYNLIIKRYDCLVYRVNEISEIQKFINIWGETDSLEIIFPKGINNFNEIFELNFYKNYSQYRKDFIRRVVNSEVIISDSGDGEEAQLIYKLKKSF